MAIIKPSTAFPDASDWNVGTIRSYMKDQTPITVDLVTDVQGNDFEQARFLWVKEKGAFYRLNLASVASDNGDTVLRDNVGRRYEKQVVVKPSFRAHLAADQTGISANTQTLLNFTAEAFDVGGYFNTSNKRWTPPAGKVVIGVCSRCTGGIVDQSELYLMICKNGGNIAESLVRFSGTNDQSNFVSVIDDANGTDYYDARVWIGGAGSKTIADDVHWTFFFGYGQ